MHVFQKTDFFYFLCWVLFPVFLVHEMHVVQTKRISILNIFLKIFCCCPLYAVPRDLSVGPVLLGTVTRISKLSYWPSSSWHLGRNWRWFRRGLTIIISECAGGVLGVIYNVMLDISRVATPPVIRDSQSTYKPRMMIITVIDCFSVSITRRLIAFSANYENHCIGLNISSVLCYFYLYFLLLNSNRFFESKPKR